MYRFDLGRRDALGPAYQEAIDERDRCGFILSATIRGWLLRQEERHRPVTLDQVNAQAFRTAGAHEFTQHWIAPFVVAGAGTVSPRTGRISAAQLDEVPDPPRRAVAEAVVPEAPGAVSTATASARPVPPSGLSAWTRALALRLGMERAMTGVDNTLPATRAAASAPAPAEGPSPSPRRLPATTPEPAQEARQPLAVQQPAPAVRRFDLTVTPLGPDEAFAQITDELAIMPSATPSGPGPATAAADARAAGLMGSQGAPGTVDLAVQRHADASDVRGAYGASGGQVQSAHLGPTSFLRDVPGYSRGNAPTTLLPTFVHAAFDQHWKNWAIARRRAGDTQVTVEALYAQMLVAVDRIPQLTQATRNTIAWAIHRELFYDLGLAPGDLLTLPYPNVPPSP
ncbi:hypothetical protein ABTY96_36775 [Streptomyces sp. NPDC096057]|uniref:hypothetical protein n=1 Tax=Streptomyces sp. NPDC096057 TaxID=3155543 RepID=UPI003330D921